MNAPTPTRAEEAREYVEDGCRVVYGRTWDGPFEKMPTEGMKDVWRDLVRKAQQPVAAHLSTAEARAARAEAEVARLELRDQQMGYQVEAAEAITEALRARVAVLEGALSLLLPFVDYAAGEGLAFVPSPNEPEMDAADICTAVAKALNIELGGPDYMAFAARSALQGGDQ